MATALDAPVDVLDVHERNFVANIREHGWFATCVHHDESGPGFTYTTGFWLTLSFPEIIVFSLRREAAHDILWDIFHDVRAGRPPPVAQPARLFANADGILLPVLVRHYPDYLGWSRWFYGNDDFQCLQLIWPDTRGNFPWQSGAEMRFRDSQPNLSIDDA